MPKPQTLKQANGNCGDDKQGDPQGLQAMAFVDLPPVTPEQCHPVAQRRKMQNMRQSHFRFISHFTHNPNDSKRTGHYVDR
jgi:hypothetical protein